METFKPMDDENYEQIKFRVYCNIIYHTAQFRFFNLIDKTINFLIIVSGSAIFVEMSSSLQNTTTVSIAILGIIQIVFDPRGSAIRHDNIRRSYHKLFNKMLESDKSETELLRKVKREIVKISSDEPPPLKVLDIISHNRACETLGYPNEEKYKVSLFYSLFCNFISFENFELKKDKIDEKI